MMLYCRKRIAIVILFNDVFPNRSYGFYKLHPMGIQTVLKVIFMLNGIPIFKSSIFVNKLH